MQKTYSNATAMRLLRKARSTAYTDELCEQSRYESSVQIAAMYASKNLSNEIPKSMKDFVVPNEDIVSISFVHSLSFFRA